MDLEPIVGILDMRKKYTLYGMPAITGHHTHKHTFTLREEFWSLANLTIFMFLGKVNKTEELEGTHKEMAGT